MWGGFLKVSFFHHKKLHKDVHIGKSDVDVKTVLNEKTFLCSNNVYELSLNFEENENIF